MLKAEQYFLEFNNKCMIFDIFHEKYISRNSMLHHDTETWGLHEVEQSHRNKRERKEIEVSLKSFFYWWKVDKKFKILKVV